MPGRQSFMVQMVEDRRDLGNAIAINSSMVNMARAGGPVDGRNRDRGHAAKGWCFFIDGISYLAVIASLLAMHVPFSPSAARQDTSTLTELKEGWTLCHGFVPIRTILLLFAMVSLMGMPLMVLMPIFAVRVLHGGPHMLGFLMGAMGVGALISALSLAVRKSVRGLVRMIPSCGGGLRLGLIGFGLSHVIWLSMLMVMFAGMGMMQGMAASNTMIQTIVSEDKRGRVMSYYTMAFMGMAPFGSLLAGTLASAMGTPFTVIVNGFAVLLGAAWFTTQLPAVRRELRPVYREMGILPAEDESSNERGSQAAWVTPHRCTAMPNSASMAAFVPGPCRRLRPWARRRRSHGWRDGEP